MQFRSEPGVRHEHANPLGRRPSLLVLSVSMIANGGAPGAGANTGDAIKAGQVTTENDETIVQNTNTSVSDCTQVTNNGPLGCGSTGVEGLGLAIGVLGLGDTGNRKAARMSKRKDRG